jgi:hypothetical protein
MKTLSLIGVIAAVVLIPAFSKQGGAGAFAGRWDLTIKTPNETYPSWMELAEVGGNAKLRVQGRVSSVHPASDVKLEGSHLSFQSMEWFGKPIPVSWEMTVHNGKITGTQKRSDGVQGEITGVPAPSLDRPAPASWSKPESLFDGQDLNGWEPDAPAKNHWKAEGGDLLNVAAGANIRTTRTFQDFKLHIEYNCPNDGNSGVYLRGRYEVQVEYEPADKNDKLHMMGSIYGFIAPAMDVKPRPGEWESFDITLVGRTVSIVRDDKVIIDHKQIPGITGGAIDSNEAEPGPLLIQGDHTGGMKYRNITIATAER